MTDAALASVDVCVAGAGPAGCAAAIALARLGHQVCLVERGGRKANPDPLSAQLLAPGCLSILDALKARDVFESAGFKQIKGTKILWGDDKIAWRTFGLEAPRCVERTRFDGLLRTVANDAGVWLIHPAEIVHAQHEDGRDRPWQVRLRRGGGELELRARIMIKAVGRSSMHRSLRARQAPPLMGIVGRLRPTPCWDSCMCVEANADRWYWAASFDNGEVVVAAFVDPRSFSLAAGLRAGYQALLRESSLLESVCRADAIGSVVACDASPWRTQAPVEPALLRVGDAALCQDPLSSQGVQYALTSGYQAAIVANTWLRAPQKANAAKRFFDERHAEAADRARRICGQLYSRGAEHFSTTFWHERALGLSEPVVASVPRPRRPVPDSSTHVRLACDVDISLTAIVRDSIVDLAPALMRPCLDRPVAFIEGVSTEWFIDLLSKSPPIEVVRTSFIARLGAAAAARAFEWLWNECLIETAD